MLAANLNIRDATSSNRIKTLTKSITCVKGGEVVPFPSGREEGG